MRSGGFASNSHYGPQGVRQRSSISREKNHRWGAVTWNMSPARVDDVGQVDTGEVFLDQLLTKFPLHEAVSCDLPGESTLGCERDNAFQKWHGERILHVTGEIALAVRQV